MAARELLESITISTANDFLQSSRYWTSPPGSSFFAPLDAILETYDHVRIGEQSTLMRGDVIEIQGPAASGKTQMLQFFAMTTCLPKTWEVALSVRGSSRPPRLETIAIGGRDRCVAVLDCDGRYSIERLYHLVRSHLARRVQEHAATIPALYSAEAEPEALHEATIAALTNVHIFKPSSLASLAGTIHQLPTYMQKVGKGELALVLIDAVSAFYWQERYQAEKGQGVPDQAVKIRNPTSSMGYVIEAINAVRRQLGVVTVITNIAFPNSGDKQPSLNAPFFRQHLSRPYPSPFVKGFQPAIPTHDGTDPLRAPPGTSGTLHITHHLTLHPAAIKQVSRDTSLENVAKEEPFRSMEQQEMGSMVFLRMPGIESGDELGRFELVVRANVIDGL